MSCTRCRHATFSTCAARQIARIKAHLQASDEPSKSSPRLGRFDARMGRSPCRRHVAAAGQQQAVEAFEGPGDVGGGIQQAELAADMQDRLLVVLDLAAIRDTDERHSVRPRYIRAGTSIPINVSARVSSSRTYDTAAARQRFSSGRSSPRIG